MAIHFQANFRYMVPWLIPFSYPHSGPIHHNFQHMAGQAPF